MSLFTVFFAEGLIRVRRLFLSAEEAVRAGGDQGRHLAVLINDGVDKVAE